MNLTASATGWLADAQQAAAVTAAGGDAPAPAGRPYWQDRPCPAWCADPGRHEAHDHPDDRVHAGAIREIVLTLQDAEVSVPPGPAAGIQVTIPHLDAYLEQAWREHEAHVALTVNDEQRISLTLAEAADLAGALADLVRQAGGQPS